MMSISGKLAPSPLCAPEPEMNNWSKRAGRLRTGGRHIGRQIIGGPAFMLPAVAAVSRIHDDRTVRPGTDVCIDGYPRSGNTWTVRAFRSWNPEASIAHHMHVPGQIRAAVRFGVPTTIVVRPPQDVAVSMIVWTGGQIPARVALWGYTRFHRQMLRLAQGIVVCTFADLVDDPGHVVSALNARFGTRFHRGSNDDAFRDGLRSDLRAMSTNLNTDPNMQAGIPSAEREALKKDVADSVAGHPWLPRAEAAYRRLLSVAQN
jgi:hypothetical protein